MSDPLELELQMVACCHVGAGDQSWVLCKTSQYPQVISFLKILVQILLSRRTPSFFSRRIATQAEQPQFCRKGCITVSCENSNTDYHKDTEHGAIKMAGLVQRWSKSEIEWPGLKKTLKGFKTIFAT